MFASSFAAALELVREGEVELNQKEAFAPLYFRKRPPQAVRRDDRAGSSGRVSGRRRPSHGKPGGKARGRCRGATSADPQARPEELRLLEALLFASAEPIDQAALAKRMPDGVDIKVALAQLQAEYAPRGVNLVRVANKWTFRTAGDLSWLMTRESTETRRLSRAAIEVLAIIAYHQPVTRAEIEEIRGVITSKGTLDVLLETGWIRPRGRRKTPGRPLTFGTTEAFLSQFSLEALGDLPGLEELKGTGLLDSRLPSGFSVPTPSDDLALREDEDPLEAGDIWNCCWRPPPSPKKARETSSSRHDRLELTVAIIRRPDSDLPRPKSLFLPPPEPTFRQSLGRQPAPRVWRVAGWVRLAFGTGSS